MRAYVLLLSLLLPTQVLAQSAVVRLEIFPADRILHAPQQLAVIAHFADGSKRDVTRWTQFTSTDEEIALVDSKGQARFYQQGEVAILCRYRIIQSVRLTYLEMRIELFLASFARLPDEKIHDTMREHLKKTKDRRQAWEDALWSIVNTREFVRRP
jgi:hypothetical protein